MDSTLLTEKIILLCLAFLSSGFMLDGHPLIAYAQLPTFPPPLPDTGSSSTTGGSSVPTDNVPPKIEILTAELHEGKNVVTVRIIDDSDLRAKFVRYVSEGKIVLSDLSKDEGNLYSALISVKGPSAVLVFEAIDLNGNRAKVAQDYTVKPLAATWLDSLLKLFVEFFSLAATWLDSLLKWFADLFSSLATNPGSNSTSSG